MPNYFPSTTPDLALRQTRPWRSGCHPRRRESRVTELESSGAHRIKTVAVILLLALAGCSKAPSSPTGVATWDEVRSLAEAFVLRGSADAIRNHTDLTGVPPEAAQKLSSMLDDWHGVSGDLTNTDIKVMTFAEFEALQREDKKDLPEDMRNAVLSATRWNVKPEKVIVFTFVSKDPKDTTTRVRWSAGAYQTNGLWFFAASYTH